MFGKNTPNTGAGKPETGIRPDAAGGINLIMQGTFIEGNITTPGNIRIDGRLKGTLQCEGKVVVGPEGLIEGNIVCHQADISGKVRGNVSVKDLITLKNTSDVTGDIITGKLSIEPGAIFTGRCNMHDTVQAPRRDSESPLTAKPAAAPPSPKPTVVESK
jgi:cytoskeletal protein CcmA (bactofilin family)